MTSIPSGFFDNEHSGPNIYIEKRPWGKFERFTLNEISTVKIITINGGEELSVQRHKNRREFWRVIGGGGRALVGSEDYEANPGGEFFIPVGVLHSMKGGGGGITILEIAFGDFDENDIERISDKYEREKNT